MHLFNLFVEVVNVCVYFIAKLLLLVLKLDHANLLNLIIKLGQLLGAALAVGQLSIIRVNYLFNLSLFLSHAFSLSLLLSFSLCLCFLFSISLSLLLLLSANILVFFLRVDFTLFKIGTIVFDVLACHFEVFLWVLDLLVNDWKD